MGDSLVVPDLWNTIAVYDAHIQSLKAFKSDYEALLSQKKELENAQKQLSDDQQALKNHQDELLEGQKGLKASQDQLAEDKTALETAQVQLRADQQAVNDAWKEIDKLRQALEGTDKELHDLNDQLRVENSGLTTEKKKLESQVEALTTSGTKLEQDNQNLTDTNTKLTAQVAERDGELGNLKSNQEQLIKDKTQLKAQNDAFTLVIQTLAQEKKKFQDQNADFTRQVADLQNKLTDPATTPLPKLKGYYTGKGGKDNWAALAQLLGNTTNELFRLNPSLDRNRYNWDTCVVYFDKS